MRNADSPKTFAFWRNLFLYFYVFSLFGHVLEATYSAFRVAFFHDQPFNMILPTMVPLSPPYGIGAVLLVVLAAPVVNKVKECLKPMKQRWLAWLLIILAAFAISAILMTATEIVSGLFCIALWGYNPFWHYYGPGAFFGGLTFMPNCLLFGLIGTIVVLVAIPPAERFLAHTNQRALNVLFWVLLVTYIADLAWTTPKLQV